MKPSFRSKLPEEVPRHSLRDSNNIRWRAQISTTMIWELARLMEPSKPTLEMGTCIPIFMDGLSASFKGMEPINSRSPVSRLLVHLSLPHSCFLLSLPDRPETKQSMSLQRGPKELSLQIGMLNLKEEGGGFQNQI